LFDTAKTTEWFGAYVKRYENDGELPVPLKLKAAHSARVAQNCLEIVKSEQITDKNIVTAAHATGLLHDIGRFEQYRKYGTFQDSVSTDHANLSAEILAAEFPFDTKQDKEIILCAIKNHNKLEIAHNLSGYKLWFSKLIRDADKIDIFFEIQERIDNGTIFDMMPRHIQYKGLTPELVQNVKETGKGSYIYAKSLDDYRLIELCWGLDLNFAYSVKTVWEAGLFDKIIEHLKPFGIDELCRDIMNKIKLRGNIQ